MKQAATPKTLLLSTRMSLCFGILVAGMLMCADGAAGIMMYPAGFMVGIGLLSGIRVPDDQAISMGYILYMSLFLAFTLAENRRLIQVLTLIMILVTVLNVAGCRHILNELDQIGK